MALSKEQRKRQDVMATRLRRFKESHGAIQWDWDDFLAVADHLAELEDMVRQFGEMLAADSTDADGYVTLIIHRRHLNPLRASIAALLA